MKRHYNKIIIKSKEQIRGIRESGKINTALLDEVSSIIKEGISTEEIDQFIYTKTKAYKATPAPLGYEGFPKSVCTSINNQVCHGIPSKHTILKEGDIINVDVSTIYNRYFSDSSRMFCIGSVSKERKLLVERTKEAMYMGLKAVKPGKHFGDIGQVIGDYAHFHHYTVVREIGGHGVGLKFHEQPYVPFIGKYGTGASFVPGMIFTIEPMINSGVRNVYVDQNNNWTVYTADGKDSAQWEIMVLVTEYGAEILAS